MNHAGGLSSARPVADDRMSLRVVEAVASAERVEPTDLAVPLSAALDPDAFDRLFETGSAADLQVAFEYDEHAVRARENGRVSVGSAVHDAAEKPDRHG